MFASFTSKFERNQTWVFWTFGYFQKQIYWTDIQLVISNIQEFLYIQIFIGICIVFVILSYFYEKAYIQHCNNNEVTHVDHITQIVNYQEIHQYIGGINEEEINKEKENSVDKNTTTKFTRRKKITSITIEKNRSNWEKMYKNTQNKQKA